MKRNRLFGFILGTVVLIGGLYLIIPDPQVGAPASSKVTQVNQVAYNGPFVLHFSQSMDKQSVESAFSISPDLSGDFSWPDKSTLHFKPNATLSVGDEYRISIAPSAQNVYRKTLDKKVNFYFEVTGPPFVQYAAPVSPITKKSPLTVMFDRPMDVSAIEDEALIEVTPDVSGRIHWIRSDVFEFIPDAWVMNTDYSVSIPSGLPADGGGQTEESFTLEFSTPSLKVAQVSLANQANVSLEQPIIVRFNQPVKLDSIKPGANVKLYPSNDIDAENRERQDGFFNTEVTYYTKENGDVDKSVLVFTPSFPYIPQAEHRLVLGESIAPIAGKNPLGESVEFTFTTASEASAESATQPMLSIVNEDELAVWLSGIDPVFPVKSKGNSELIIEFCSVSDSQYIAVSQQYQWPTFNCSNPKRHRQELPETDDTVRFDVDLAEQFDVDFAPGLYFVSVEAVNGTEKSLSFHQPFIVTDTALTVKKSDSDLLVWASDLRTGEPIARMDIRVYGPDGNELLRGVTDGEGVYRIAKPMPTNVYIVGQKNLEDETRWSFATSQWQVFGDYNPAGNWLHPGEPQIYLYSDRSVYTPGSVLEFKGIYRIFEANRPAFSSTKTVNVRLMKDESVLDSKRVPLNRDGSFDESFTLPTGLSNGVYELQALAQVQELPLVFSQPIYIKQADSPNFSITAQKLPTFQYADDPFAVEIDVRQYLGRPLPDREVQYRLFESSYQPEALDGYGDYFFGPWGTPEETHLIKEGVLKLNASGKATIELEPAVKQVIKRKKYILNLNMADPLGNPIPYYQEWTAVPGEFFIGLQMRPRFLNPFDPVKARIALIDSDGQLITNTPLDLKVYKNSSDQIIHEESYVSGSEPDDVLLNIRDSLQPGVYRLVAEGVDEKGNQIVSEIKFFVSDSDDEHAPPAASLQLIPDQEQYFVGGKARVVLRSPFTPGDNPQYGLVTYERNGTLGYQFLKMDDPMEVVDIPIDESMLPNVYVNAILLQGKKLTAPSEESTDSILELLKNDSAESEDRSLQNVSSSDFLPSIAQASVQLNISKREKQLSVSMDSRIENDTLVLDVHTTDYQNRPVASVVSVAVSEAGFMSRIQHPIDFFFQNQSNQVATTSVYQPRFFNDFSGERTFNKPEYLNVTVQTPAELHFFEPLVQTDDGGYAQVKVPLDDAGQYDVRVVATHGEDQFGMTQQSVGLSNALLIEPVSPSTVYQGDQFDFGAKVRNVSDQSVQTDIEISADGLSIQSFSHRSITVEPHETKQVSFTATADDKVGIVPVVLQTAQQRIVIDLNVANAKSDQLLSIPHKKTVLYNALKSSFVVNQENIISQLLGHIVTDHPDQAEHLIRVLEGNQRFDGGIAFTQSGDSSPLLSAYALFVLSQANSANIDYPEELSQGLVNYLWRAIGSPENLSASTQVFVSFALSEVGQYDTRLALRLFDDRNKLPFYARALLLINLQNLYEAGQRSLNPFIDRLQSELIDEEVSEGGVSYLEEPSVNGSDLKSHIKATAMTAYALARIDIDNPAIKPLLRYLALTSQPFSQHDIAWSLIALQESEYDDLQPTQEFEQFTFNPDPYFIHHQFVVFDKPESTISVEHMRHGQRYRGKLKVIVPKDQPHALVMIPLPAGVIASTSGDLQQNDLRLSAEEIVLDDRIALYAENLPAGVYEYEYHAYAVTPGTYTIPPAKIQSMYFPAHQSQTDAGQLSIRN